MENYKISIMVLLFLVTLSCGKEKNRSPIKKEKSVQLKQNTVNKIHYSNNDTIYFSIVEDLKVIYKEEGDLIIDKSYWKILDSIELGRGIVRLKKTTIDNNNFKVENYSYSFDGKKITLDNFNSKGVLKNFSEIDLQEAQATGQWFFYDDNGSLHQIGKFKNGIKNGIWYTMYEDSNLPKIEYFQNGNPISFKGKLIIYNENNKKWIVGKEVLTNGVPTNKWIYYNYDDSSYSVINYKSIKDKMTFSEKIFNLNTNELIEELHKTVDIDKDIYNL